MPKINVLPKSVAELIAAGEVVERPASAVKELCENSVDAGATVITVEIRAGGKTYIRITDNGSGIERGDIRNAFVSHATSKIRTGDDLERIMTLGFRGEALASVCAVSKVDVLTKTDAEESGTHYVIECGEEILLDDAGCPRGTTIVVRSLFGNVPARMKFLKKDVSEGNFVGAVLEKLAVSHPEISVRFIRDGKTVFETPGDGKLKSALRSVFGAQLASQTAEVSYSTGGAELTGCVSLPLASRGSRAMELFFVNGRSVKSPTATAALEEAYKGTVMVGKYPACALFITLPADAVDVNVSPSKTEVRFADERKIFDVVYNGVKNAVAAEDVRPKAVFSAAGAFIRPDEAVQQTVISGSGVPGASEGNRPGAVAVREYGSFSTDGLHVSAPSSGESTSADGKTLDFLRDEKPVYIKSVNIDISCDDDAGSAVDGGTDGITAPANECEISADECKVTASECETAANEAEELFDESKLTLLGEAYGTFIFALYSGRLYVVDKHAAHERIIYNRLIAARGSVPSQQLLLPLSVRLSPDEYAAVCENETLLERAGYDLSPYSDCTVAVRGCPEQLAAGEAESALTEIAAHLSENGRNTDTEKLDWIYHSSACRAAVKAGDSLTSQEQKVLLCGVFSNRNVMYCPHGRPVAALITEEELKKLFRRI